MVRNFRTLITTYRQESQGSQGLHCWFRGWEGWWQEHCDFLGGTTLRDLASEITLISLVHWWPEASSHAESSWKQELQLGQLQIQAFLYTWLKQVPSGLTLVLAVYGLLTRHEGSIPHLIAPLFIVPACASQIRSSADIFICLLWLDSEGNSLVWLKSSKGSTVHSIGSEELLMRLHFRFNCFGSCLVSSFTLKFIWPKQCMLLSLT